MKIWFELLEIVQEKVRDWFINEFSDKVYMQWASCIFLVICFLCRKYDKIFGLKDFIPSAIVIIILGIFISRSSVKLLEKFVPEYVKRFTAYENENGHYYLKEEYINVRKVLKFILAGVSFPVVIAEILSMFQGGAADILSSKLLKEESIKYILEVCILLEYAYLSGETYEEALKNFEMTKHERWSLKSWNRLCTDVMEDSIRLIKKINFPVAYGIKYPQNSFKEKYKEMFASLMKDENIYIENIFFHDWGLAFIIPVNTMLLKGRKVVIFAGSFMDTDKIAVWLEKELRRVLGIEKSWSIGIWEDTRSEYDICLVSYEEVRNFIQARDTFPARGVFCVLMGAAEYISEIQFCMEEYAAFLAKKNIPPVYCFADRYIEGFLDYFSHVFQCKIKKVEVDLEKAKEIVLCVSENSNKNELKKYWGSLDGNNNGITFFNELWKAYVKDISYVSEKVIPIKDMCNNLKNKVSIKSQKDGQDFEEVLAGMEFCKSIWEIKKQKRQYIIVEDENCNFYDLYWYLSTRGEDICNIFILSEKYQLFDFMIKNAKYLINVRNAVPIFFPVYQDTDRNRILKLIRMASKKGLDVSEILVEEKELYRVFPEWENKKLQECEIELNRMAGEYYEDIFFGMHIGKLVIFTKTLKKYSMLWKEVVIIDEAQDKKLLNGMLTCHFDQRWLEEQYMAFGGYYYQIKSIRRETERTEVLLLRSQAHLQNPGFYYQRKVYDSFECLKEVNYKYIRNNIRVGREKVSLNVETTGWYRRTDGDGIIEEKDIHNTLKRKYKNKEALFWIFENGSNINEEFCINFLKLLKEIIRTIYPFHYQYMEFLYNHICCSSERNLSSCKFYFIEDCEDDIGLVDSMEKNIEKILDICYEYSRSEDF